MPTVDASYWLAMGIAGTLGTVCGDGLSAGLRFGAGVATAGLAPVAAGLFAARAAPSFAGKRGYWLVVATIRTIGTTFGDWSADGIGLVPATGASGVLLAALAACEAARGQRGFAPRSGQPTIATASRTTAAT